MRLFKEINILTDKKTIWYMNLLSIAILIITTIVTYLIATIITPTFTLIVAFSWKEMLLFAGVFIVTLICHELIHGFFFKRYSEQKTVKYGFQSGMIYASNPGALYSRKQFLIIGLAPFVIISGILIPLMILGIGGLATIIIFIIHTSGCAGDFWYTYEIIKNKQITSIEDTPTGIKFFEKEQSEASHTNER